MASRITSSSLPLSITTAIFTSRPLTRSTSNTPPVAVRAVFRNFASTRSRRVSPLVPSITAS
jgi:hypothetical protein